MYIGKLALSSNSRKEFITDRMPKGTINIIYKLHIIYLDKNLKHYSVHDY